MNKHLQSYQGNEPAEATAPRGRLTFDLMDPASFQHIQRVAGMYASSPLFPEHLRKGGQQSALANAVLVMNIAERLREDPLTVAQQIYFVGGKPGWAATYMIAKANQHGVFKNPIDWKVTGKKDNLSVTAHAELASTGKKVEVTVDMETASAEGWTRNSKYKSMPEQMLRYRSATALIRLYCPEVMIGVPPANEVEDQHYSMRDVTPEAPDEQTAAPDPFEPEVEDAEVQEEEEPEPKKQARKPVDRTPPAPAKKAGDPVQEKEPESEPEKDEAPEGDAPAQEEEPEPETEPEQDQGQGDMLGDTTKEEPKANWNALRQAVVADLEGTGGDIDPVVSFYRDKLKAMKREAPDIFAALEKEIGIDIASEL